MKLRSSVIAVATVGVLALAACAGPSDNGSDNGDATPIKLGLVTPLSGTYGSEGEEMRRGLELALEAHDYKAGDHPVEMVVADAFAANDAIAAVNKLVSQDQVDLLIGTYATPTSQAASEEAAKQDVSWIEFSSITDSLTKRGLETYIRTGARAIDFAEASADFLINGLGDKLSELSVYVDAENGPYGTSVLETQANALEEAGWTVSKGSHATAATDVTDSVLAAKAADPAVWLLTGYNPDLTLLLRTAAEQNFKPEAIVLTGAGDAPSVFEAVGPETLAGTFVVAYSSLITDPGYSPGMADYYAAYKAKYNSEPLGTVASTAYTGMTAILAILEASDGSTDPTTIREGALTVDIPIGGLPNGWGLKLDEDGQNQRIRLTTVQWREDGSLPAVWPADAPAAGEELVLNR